MQRASGLEIPETLSPQTDVATITRVLAVSP
jgi:hypothetical protein